MKTITNLYDLAEKENIPIISFHISNDDVEALSQCDDDGDCIIAIDNTKIKNEADLKVKMAHELGHCETGAFYNRYSPYDEIGRHEYRADKWAVYELIPFDELVIALNKGYNEAWQLAEYFEVPENFIERAFDIYRAKGLL